MVAKDKDQLDHILALPFVRRHSVEEMKTTHRYCSWWGGLKETGDALKDEQIGNEAAEAYLRFDRADNAGMINLPKIIADMPRDLGMIEIGFLWRVGRAAVSGMRA